MIDHRTHPEPPLILLTGVTGYVGGRLAGRLEERGQRVRAMSRRPDHADHQTADTTESVYGDALARESLDAAMAGVHTACYLIHSLGSGEDFEQLEQQAATNFADAAREAGVRRIVYLGGLGDHPESSPHLRSRRRVGRILADAVPTIEFRASIIIGSGSLSFELIRSLARRLPLMVVPRWGYTQTQPISIEDVLDYLVAGLDLELDEGEQHRVYEIGGPDRVSYVDLMQLYARQRGLRRLMIPVPVLTPRLSSLWLGLVTPVYARVGRKLIESTETSMLVRDDRALRDFDLEPRGVDAALERALVREDEDFARTRWNDALSAAGEPHSYGGVQFGSRLIDSRVAEVDAAPADAFAPIRRVGGRSGWYYGNFLWRIRGFLDLLVGGVGLRRGRRDPDHLQPGETVDFWRVEQVDPPNLLRLRAEMKVPGRAWLQFEVEPTDRGSRIRQTAIFDPTGLLGLMYWYALWPLHGFVFRGMLRGVAQRAEAEAATHRAR